jgi:hypothetical protein
MKFPHPHRDSRLAPVTPGLPLFQREEQCTTAMPAITRLSKKEQGRWVVGVGCWVMGVMEGCEDTEDIEGERQAGEWHLATTHHPIM